MDKWDKVTYEIIKAIDEIKFEDIEEEIIKGDIMLWLYLKTKSKETFEESKRSEMKGK